MLATQIKDFTIVRGDTFVFGVEFCKLKRDLTEAYLTVKKCYEEEEYIFQKRLNEGISEVKQGVYRVRIAPEDTENLEPDVYYYDLEVHVDDDVKTILMGKLTLHPDVTLVMNR